MDIRPRSALAAGTVALCLSVRALGAEPALQPLGPSAARVAAASSADRDYVGQRYFGLLASIGFFAGFAGGVQVGTQDVGARVLAGYSPVFIAVQESSGQADIRFFSGYQVAPDLFASLLPAADWARVGAQCGYRYHSLLGHGLALGGFGAFRITRQLEGTVVGGLLIFPRGDEELREHEHVPSSVETVFPGANVNWGVNVGLSLFP